MKARITDRKVLESLQPFDLSTYLRSERWTLAGYMGDAATVWRRDNHQVLLPRDVFYADYARRVAELLDTLAEVENRSQLEILRDLATAGADVIRVRVASQLAVDGSVALEEGVTLFECAKDILLSAARAAITPRAYFRSRLPGPAEDYIRKVRLGQTEHGSYVVTLVCPVSPELQSPSETTAATIEEPYDRRVTRMLAGALHKTASAARDAALSQDMTAFTSGIGAGVSSNLCNALAKIGEGMEGGQIEINFSWSRSRRAPDVVSSRIVIPQNVTPIMREAARVLKETYRDDDFELSGPVVRMDSPEFSTGGDVFIFAQIDTPRRVKVRLEGADYAEAVRAHQEGLDVRCRGQLQKEGLYYTLNSARDFTVMADSP